MNETNLPQNSPSPNAAVALEKLLADIEALDREVQGSRDPRVRRDAVLVMARAQKVAREIADGQTA